MHLSSILQADICSSHQHIQKEVTKVLQQLPARHRPSAFVCREAGQEDIQFAADLAAYFSKARAEGKTPVTTCQAGDVKRPKGGKPGQALVAREKTHVGRPHKSAAAAMEEQ